MKQPTISVLMPVFNTEQYVGEAIKSVLSQSFKDFEFIIADDASTDSTPQILKEYAKKDKRIRIISNKNNLYIAGNRNNLIEAARGEFIAWADADDISLPDRLERQLKIMQSDGSIGICGGYLQIFNNTDIDGQIRTYPCSDQEIRKKIFRYVPVAQPAAMIRASVFEAVGDYDLSKPPAEDLDMLFRIGRDFKFANIDSVAIKYRDHGASATYKKLKKMELVSVSLRLSNRRTATYRASGIDILYNLLHWCSIWIIPARLKIALFNRLRNG